MHELGVLRQIIKTVDRITKENKIAKVKHITLEVGDVSGYVPYYLKKLFPVAVDSYPKLENCELKLLNVKGSRLIIKDIGY